jgi:KDO2-lipid IV(A) lauroyltransferase
MIAYLVIRLATWLVRRVPTRWGTAITRWIGRAIYRVSPLAEAGRDNARHVLGPQVSPDQIAQVARQAFENRVLNTYDMLRLSDQPLGEVSSRTWIEGMEHIQHIVDEKQGAVIVSAHIGPMEFMIQAVTALGYPFIGITEHLKPERLHQYVIGLRSAHGLNLISTQASLLDVYRRIKRGEVLLSSVDRDSTETGRIVDFFGAPAWLPDGYARIAVRANVPLVFGYSQRTADGAKGKVFPPIYPDHSLGKEAAIQDVILRTVRCLEEAVREDPSQWHLSTPVWRLAQDRMGKGSSA